MIITGTAQFKELLASVFSKFSLFVVITYFVNKVIWHPVSTGKVLIVR